MRNYITLHKILSRIAVHIGIGMFRHVIAQTILLSSRKISVYFCGFLLSDTTIRTVAFLEGALFFDDFRKFYTVIPAIINGCTIIGCGVSSTSCFGQFCERNPALRRRTPPQISNAYGTGRPLILPEEVPEWQAGRNAHIINIIKSTIRNTGSFLFCPLIHPACISLPISASSYVCTG